MEAQTRQEGKWRMTRVSNVAPGRRSEMVIREAAKGADVWR